MLFQFLYGTIKREDKKRKPYGKRLFQFLYGTIKRWTDYASDQTNYDFNSSMVQLKEENLDLRPGMECYFNSSMVQLKDPPDIGRTGY